MPRPDHLAFARSLRRSSTDAERRMWSILRNRRLGGYKFNRQVPVDRYVADFVCRSEMLIVEVDGGQHAEHVAYDDARSRCLAGHGYRVMRFWNNEVLAQTEAVAGSILMALESTSPTPSPSPQGEGR